MEPSLYNKSLFLWKNFIVNKFHILSPKYISVSFPTLSGRRFFRCAVTTFCNRPRISTQYHRLWWVTTLPADTFLWKDLVHGCAWVAHCVTARWRNFSHYCRPLRQYDVWFTCSEHREALPGAPTAHGVHKQEFTVQGGSTWLATEQVGRLRYVTAVDGGLEAFPLSIVICAPVT